MWFTDASRGKLRAQDPLVIRFGGRYLMYYLLAPKVDDSESLWQVAIAESQDLESWTKLIELRVDTSVAGSGMVAGSALVHDDKVHLFYYTYGTGRDDAICYAVSEDGINFRPAPGNPVFRAEGDWNCGRAVNPWVTPFENGFRLYFCSRDPNMEKQFIMAADIASADDFTTGQWQPALSAPLLLPELDWEQDSVESPVVCKQGKNYYMFYGGAFHNQPQQIGCAISKDGLNWSRLGEAPWLPTEILPDGSRREYAEPSLLRDEDGSDYLFVQVSDDIGQSWYITYFPIKWENDVPVLVRN